MIDSEVKPKTDGDLIFWQEQNEAWIKSGFPQEKFCKLNNLSYPKFLVWRSKINAQTQAAKPKKFLPLRVAPSAELPASQIKLRMPNGVLLEFPSSLSTNQLQPLFKLLGVIA